MNLARAFDTLLTENPGLKGRVRLVMVGEGPQREPVEKFLVDAGRDADAWLPGARNDVPHILRQLDLFVLPSRGEGISNTVLEAMASGLPVVATRVGGNDELVVDGETGALVPHSDASALALAMADYAGDAERRRRHGTAARNRACNVFSLQAMTRNYMDLYDNVLPH